ncbi:ADP-ribosyltransferase [Cellulomonas bogoriensis]|uniref:NAD(+)--protein-arginine ADP-ribosyltransferase n=1 Tax=Cellulomonas bogoriensis 69B4 = DSM 16987 TaxID=1386082 RepID=A0A0A0BVR8_9CELL|nr:ADP-ribosyltransferase [Cellulomonas bogoriensis]KGM12503.1 hypothetical protein N869_14650 [Cellulomonas bogoriensis 69B4 = DSM 16987]
MTTNPLIAGPVDTSTALSGTLTIESLANLSRAIREEQWLDAALNGVSTLLGTAAAVMDPLGQLIAHGLGWLMEHLQPLKGWLNDLTGDAGAVLGFAATWDNIATQTAGAADDLQRLVRVDLEAMDGEGVLAYARYTDDLAEHVRGISGASAAVGSALRKASTIVQVVHDLVRDALAEVVGAAISWVAQVTLSAGLATPWVIGQVTTRVSSLAARVGTKVTAVVTSVKSLKGLVEALKDALGSVSRALRSATPGAGRAAGGPAGPAPRRAPDPYTGPRAPLPDIDDLQPMMRGAYGPDGTLQRPELLHGWADQVAARHPTLTSREVLDIHWYTTNEGYQAMNSMMRRLEPMSPEVAARIDSAHAGMAKLPVYEGTTYRGTNFPKGVLDDWIPGNTVRDDAFWSSSTRPDVAQGFRGDGNAFVTIQDGRSGVDIRALSYYGNESEVLFRGGHPFEVVSRDWNAGGFWEFVVRDAR